MIDQCAKDKVEKKKLIDKLVKTEEMIEMTNEIISNQMLEEEQVVGEDVTLCWERRYTSATKNFVRERSCQARTLPEINSQHGLA